MPFSAVCENVMTPEGGFPIEVSSNPDDKDKLQDSEEGPWQSIPSDEEDGSNPSITVTVTDDNQDKYVDDVIITGTTNVESVTVTVYDESGKEVTSNIDFLKPAYYSVMKW